MSYLGSVACTNCGALPVEHAGYTGLCLFNPGTMYWHPHYYIYTWFREDDGTVVPMIEYSYKRKDADGTAGNTR
jgi:hypothetical protein